MHTFRISGLAGDTIYSIPLMKAIAQQEPIRLYLNEGQLGKWYREPLLPLLNDQGIDARLYDGEPFEFSLDTFRNRFNVSEGHIPDYFAEMAGLPLPYEPYLTVDYQPHASIVVGRSHRYTNHRLDWSCLKGRDIIFVGLESEYRDFNRIVPCQFHRTNDFLEAARVIAGCRFFIGNQSALFAIAHGLGVPRILERCLYCPNVQSGHIVTTTNELEAACQLLS